MSNFTCEIQWFISSRHENQKQTQRGRTKYRK